MTETRYIDMLYLELSQFTTASTAKEIDLYNRLTTTNNKTAELECCANCTHIEDSGDHFECKETKATLENYEVLNLQIEPCEHWEQRKIK